MNFGELKEQDKEYIANTYLRFDVDIAKGNGATCTSLEGREYIDFTSGIGVNSLGFCNPGWTAAVKKQLDSFAHISNLYYTQPCVKLAKELCEKTGLKKVFFANSGAEANEGAIKAARKYSSDKYGSAERHEIVTLVNSFHGRTITTLCATGQEAFHKNFQPLTTGFSYAQAGNIADLEAKVSTKTCAVMLELIQGEGGVIPLEEAYVRQVAAYCEGKDLLLIVDEVQTGIGRTGKLFCYEHYGIHPDIVTAAKGLGGGLPIGAVVFGEKVQAVLGYGDHGSTFGGNPVSCAGAAFILESLTQDFLEEVTAKGDYIRSRLSGISTVEVCGKGLMLGLELKAVNGKKPIAINLARACVQNGLLILTAKDKLRLLPPLSISKEEIDKGLAILMPILS